MKRGFPFTRREFCPLLAGGVTAPLAAEEAAPDLWRLSTSAVAIEAPGEDPRLLTPDPARSEFGAKIAEFPRSDPLAIRQVVRDLGGGVLERALEVMAEKDAVFNLELGYDVPGADAFHGWLRKESAPVTVIQDKAVQEKAQKARLFLFPFAGAVEGNWLIGAVADTPGLWENRSQQVIDPVRRRIALRTGDGSAERMTLGVGGGDWGGLYHARFDGWQHIRKGQLRQFRTWLFAAPVRDLYDVQMAAHRALATGKGWNDSALAAILRNTAYLLIRRNLTRNESRYILISGATYGWHQWCATAAMAGLGLQDPAIQAEALRGLYWARLNYEDCAQWYLIVSALLARSGFAPDLAMCRRCVEFLRDHEKNGAYVPPEWQSAPTARLGWKTYMDIFYYAEGDAPTTNQGFHCGALIAAQELGFPVSHADVQRACAAYAEMFNRKGGYFPTSMMRPEVFGGDALYGEAVTFAAFGRKALPDDLVLRHCRHAMKIQTPYGIRVNCKANGDLLEADQYGPGNPHGLPPEKAGFYVQGGSWFFCDAGTWLSGLAHGLDAKLVDSLLIRRIKAELARVPAFNESIHTRTGEPHGNILYSDNSLYLWLRPAIRKRMGHEGPDPVDLAIDEYLRNRMRQGGL